MTPLLILLATLWAPPVLPPASSGSVEDPLEKAEHLYREGSSLYEAADYTGAIQKFTAALTLASAVNANAIKRSLLWNIAISHERAFAVDGDERHLRQAQILYRQYVGLLASDEEAARAEATVNLTRVHGLLERASQSPPPPAPDPTSREPEVAQTPHASKRHLKVGVGLLAPGLTTMVTGAVLVGVGAPYEDNAKEQVDMLADLGIPRDDPAWGQGAEFVAQERRKGRVLMAVGGSLLGAGTVLVSVGTYYMVKSKRVKLRAVPTTSYFGISIQGRF